MPTYDYPYIRDVLTIDKRVQAFYDQFAGDGPVFLIGRRVKHVVDLRVSPRRPLVIVADVYDGNGKVIDASGEHASGVAARGADGARPGGYVDASGVDHPTGPGDSGQPGEPGGAGERGGTVTVYCRRSVDAHIKASGGDGTAGGAGGNGQRGGNGRSTPDHTEWVDDTPDDLSDFVGHEVFEPGETVEGTPGGDGGAGGAGGAGGDGGVITFISISDDNPPVLEAHGGKGGPGGPGGAAGPDGLLSPTQASAGFAGADGASVDGQVIQRNVSVGEYVAGLRSVLDTPDASYANYWAPFRVATGEYLYYRHNPAVADRADCARRAAVEFDRALELQPDNADALRLQRQLVGVPQPVEVTPVRGPDGSVWTAEDLGVPYVGGGNNALGLPPDFDVQPNFQMYIDAFASFSALVLGFVQMGVTELAEATELTVDAAQVELQRQHAVAARDNTSDDVDIATAEQRLATDEADYVQQQLDQTIVEIQAALAALSASSLGFGDIVGTVADFGAAVVGVAAAIPTGGASLVALVPATVALADSVLTNAAPIAQALLAGTKPDIDAVKQAYEHVGKDVSSVVAAGKSIVNFVTVAQRLGESTTADNAQHMELVRRGAELAHQVLVARNRVALAGQRVDAAQARLSRADGIVAEADALCKDLGRSAVTVRRVAELAINAAASKADALLNMAFRAERSLEIYTLQDQRQNLFLDVGRISPDDWRDYAEADAGDVSHLTTLLAKLTESWQHLLQPTGMQADYLAYFDSAHDRDQLRLSFAAGDPALRALQETGRFGFRVEATDIPANRADAKIRSVRLALVGAVAVADEVSCDVRHGARYEQRRADGTIAVQLLQPKISTRPAKLARLAADEGLGEDPPLTAPRSLALWGRGIGGDWEVSIPESESASGLDLAGLTEIQVWIGYQFRRA